MRDFFFSYMMTSFYSIRKEALDKFTLLIASAHRTGSPVDVNSLEIPVNGRPLSLTVEYGDFSEPLSKVIDALKHAKQHAANEHQAAALENYIKSYVLVLAKFPLPHSLFLLNTSFETGSIDHHKEGSRHWVKDVGPSVESYIGFIEAYVDPYGARAEWEGERKHCFLRPLPTCPTGFTAIVNKELSAKYNVLVENAPRLIEILPWGKRYEVDVFRRPDFTALEIVNFATGGKTRSDFLPAIAFDIEPHS